MINGHGYDCCKNLRECQLTEGFLIVQQICPIKVYSIRLLDQMNDGVRAVHTDSSVVYFGTQSQEMTVRIKRMN